MNTILASYGRVLRQASRGGPTPLDLIGAAGGRLARLDAADWYSRAGDESLLDACTGPTLDVGCGPGRLAAALIRRGVPAEGIDISAEAVRQARARGVPAELTDVFTVAGSWQHVLLADGNIGIGGDPVRLARRCRELLAPNGYIVVELGAPGSGTWRQLVRLRHDGRLSASFWWAAVAIDHVAALGLRIRRVWTSERRWFAQLD